MEIIERVTGFTPYSAEVDKDEGKTVVFVRKWNVSHSKPLDVEKILIDRKEKLLSELDEISEKKLHDFRRLMLSSVTFFGIGLGSITFDTNFKDEGYIMMTAGIILFRIGTGILFGRGREESAINALKSYHPEVV